MRTCKQCGEELFEGETDYCCTCYDYIEHYYWIKRKRKEEDNAAHS